jgi:hypothetical protein
MTDACRAARWGRAPSWGGLIAFAFLVLVPRSSVLAQTSVEGETIGGDDPALGPTSDASLSANADESDPHQALPVTRFFGALSVGKGLRFNNPYRLESVLGDDARSVSATATYVDGSAAFAHGPADGLQHGAQLHLGAAVEGVRQPFLSASYLLALRVSDAWLLYGRIGPSFLLAPDPNAGGELALSASWFFTQGLGLTSEIVGNLYYGAATLERQTSVVPIASFQAGIIADYELLP